MLLTRRTVLTCLVCLLGLAIPIGAEVLFETAHLAIRIDDTGAVKGLLDHGNSVNYQAPDQSAPLLSIRVAGQIHLPQAMHYEEGTEMLTLKYSEGIAAV